MAKVTNFDDLMRLCTEARRRGNGSKAWIEFATVMMDSFPAIYETAKGMNSEFRRLRNQVQAGKNVVAAGVELMTTEQVSYWGGVRSFLEQGTSDYSDEPHNIQGNGPR